MFAPSFFDHLEDRLALAVYDTNEEFLMGLKLQGLAAKVAKLQHDAEFEAGKLDARLEGVAAKLPTVFSGANGAIDSLAKDIGDVEAILNEVQSVTNGGPPLSDTTTSAAAIPTPSPVTANPDVVHDDTGAVIRPVLST